MIGVFFPLLIPGSGYNEKKATLDFTETECLQEWNFLFWKKPVCEILCFARRSLDTPEENTHTGTGRARTCYYLTEQPTTLAWHVPPRNQTSRVFITEFFFTWPKWQTSIGSKNYEAKIFDHASLFSGYTLFLGSFMAIWNEGQALLRYNRPSHHCCTEAISYFWNALGTYIRWGPSRRSLWQLDSELNWYTLRWRRKKINCWGGHLGAKTDSLRRD